MANTDKNPQFAACSVALNGPSDGAMQIFPAGEFDAPRGAMRGAGPWRMDAAAAAALITRVAGLKNPILIDYEHQSLLAADNGKPVPAAGWLSRDGFVWREGEGFFHRKPEWTAAASQGIAANEYRYVSAVFSYDPESGHPLDIHSVALTNQPAIDGLAPVVAALTAKFLAAMAIPQPTPEENPMDEELIEFLEDLRWMVSIPPQSTVAALKAALVAALAQLPGAPAPADFAAAASARRPFNLGNAVAALAAKQQPDPALFVPLAQFESLKTDFAALKAAHDAQIIGDLVEPALSDGRLLPAQEAWARELGKSNLAALMTYLKTAQPIAALNSTQTGGREPPGADPAAPSKEVLAACKQAGVTLEQYQAGADDLKTRFPGAYQ